MSVDLDSTFPFDLVRFIGLTEFLVIECGTKFLLRILWLRRLTLNYLLRQFLSQCIFLGATGGAGKENCTLPCRCSCSLDFLKEIFLVSDHLKTRILQ